MIVLAQTIIASFFNVEMKSTFVLLGSCAVYYLDRVHFEALVGLGSIDLARLSVHCRALSPCFTLRFIFVGLNLVSGQLSLSVTLHLKLKTWT